MAYSNLKTDQDSFSNMMKGFGVVTVMNARIFEYPANQTAEEIFNGKTAEDIRVDLQSVIATGSTSTLGFKLLSKLDTLKVANITVEGPNKTVTGGRYSNPLIKFGKSARLEMQDALGNATAIEAFGGAVNEFSDSAKENIISMHVTEDFAPARLIIGDSFFIGRESGKQVKVNIIFYQVLPDSIFNLTQDAEGDATVFDMNADLLTTEISIGTDGTNSVSHGVFYSIVEDKSAASGYAVNAKTLTVTGTKDGDVVYYSSDAGATWSSSVPQPIKAGNTYMIKVVSAKGVNAYNKTIVAEAAAE
jgi:hypothetical protein